MPSPRGTAGAAAVLDEPVALHNDRELGLGDFDGHVGSGCYWVAESVVAVADGGGSPCSDEEFKVDERVGIVAVTTDDHHGVTAFARSRHPIGDELCKSAIHCV